MAAFQRFRILLFYAQNSVAYLQYINQSFLIRTEHQHLPTNRPTTIKRVWEVLQNLLLE